jgi:hypothetical protein
MCVAEASACQTVFVLHVLPEEVAVALAQRQPVARLGALHHVCRSRRCAGDVFLQFAHPDRGADGGQQQRQRRQTLLAVHHGRFRHRLGLDEHDAAQKVGRRIGQLRRAR